MDYTENFPEILRFTDKIKFGSPDECWEWQASRMKGDYEYGFATLGGRLMGAHRAAHLLWRGPIPDTTPRSHIHHRCENPPCVNPFHLEATTARGNLMASDTPARRNSEKTHCPKGHPYEGDNLVLKNHPSGRVSRLCKQCEEERWFESRNRRRATGGENSVHPHGDMKRYWAGCRCPVCKEANHQYMVAYKAKRKLTG